MSALGAPREPEDNEAGPAGLDDAEVQTPFLWDLGSIAPTWQRSANLAIKRGLDIMGAASGLAVLAPLLMLVGLAIHITSPGPVLFRQSRLGRDGVPFTILKFRTMDLHGVGQSGIRQAVAGDSRVTPVGKLLRETSLDELPQLFNVLMGDMSLVGPRPHIAGMLAGGMHYERLVPHYSLRASMRPGMTGWAQANGLRGPTHDIGKATARIEHDIAYVKRFTVWFDIAIVWRTLTREFLGGTGV